MSDIDTGRTFYVVLVCVRLFFVKPRPYGLLYCAII